MKFIRSLRQLVESVMHTMRRGWALGMGRQRGRSWDLYYWNTIWHQKIWYEYMIWKYDMNNIWYEYDYDMNMIWTWYEYDNLPRWNDIGSQQQPVWSRMMTRIWGEGPGRSGQRETCTDMLGTALTSSKISDEQWLKQQTSVGRWLVSWDENLPISWGFNPIIMIIQFFGIPIYKQPGFHGRTVSQAMLKHAENPLNLPVKRHLS